MTIRRDAPGRSRTLKLDTGSEEEIGRQLLEVLRTEGDGHVVFAEGSFWEHSRKLGYWAPIPDDELHRIVGSFDGSTYPGKAPDVVRGKRTMILRVSHGFARGAIQRAASQASEPGFFVGAAPVIVFADCAVRISSATGQVERLPRSPDHRARAGYAFPFRPAAKASRFRQMMREHFEGDFDATEKMACLQEFFGGCLLGIAPTKQKCVALPSDGGSGRSTMMECIDAAMPKGSVAHMDVTELRSKERRAKLPAKRLVYSDECPTDAFLEDENFKRVVTGNTVFGEEKYRSSFEFRPICGLVVLAQLLATAELSDAFFRRFIIIRYNRSFEGSSKRDYDLAATIIATEVSGIVAWMIEGAARLLRNGKYTIPPSHHAEEAKWKLTADTVRAFLDAAYTKSTFKEPRTKGYDRNGRPNGKKIRPHDWTAGSILYGDYRTWCEQSGHRKPVAIQEFGRRLAKIGYPTVHTHKGNFVGVRLLEKAQKQANEVATAKNTPPERLKGAVSILQGAKAHCRQVIQALSLPPLKDEG